MADHRVTRDRGDAGDRDAFEVQDRDEALDRVASETGDRSRDEVE